MRCQQSGVVMKKVKVRLDELIDAFDNCRIGFEYWLNLKTGELITVGEDRLCQK